MKLFRLHLLVLVCLFYSAAMTWGQATVNVRVISVQVLNNVDCDGLLSGDSDFVWEFLATDNTLGNSNNNPVLFGLLGDFNYAYQNGNNGPYTMTAPGAGFSPSNGLYFSHDYVCPTDVPTNIVIDWRAYDNDDILNYTLLFGSDGETAPQTVNMAVPAVGTVNQTFFASSTDGGCPQNYAVTFQVETIPLVLNYLEDQICDAWQATLNTTYNLAWCPSATLEVNEPHTGDVTANGSIWVKFIAPASGEVEITTDLSGTELGTYFQVYHAVDGLDCSSGIQPITSAVVKDKFEYLSHHEFSDGTDLLSIDPEAEIILDACDPVSPFSYQKVHPGEVYYVQISADAGGDRGYYQLRINDLGGASPPNAEDIPCNSPITAYGTTPISSVAGSAASMNLSFGCAYDGGNNFGETGAVHTSSSPNQYHAYDYDHPAASNGTMNESVWLNIVAPINGRIVFETDYQSSIYSEDAALFGYDKRFSPGIPSDYSCANLEVLAAQEGGLNGILGGASESALIMQQCMEPGYTYYGMVDPANNLTLLNAQNIDVWVYDPSTDDAINNPPGNDILCLAMADTLYEIPVTPAGTNPTFQAVAGSNERGCTEYLAGEPGANADSTLRADQTVWHYFTVPPSGAIEMNLRAYIGMDTLRYAVYELLNGSDCYGGLNPATFTNDGTQLSPIITPVLTGSAGFTGTQESICCMTPGTMYALQLDGGSAGDEGQYIIEYIREIAADAGDTYVEMQSGEIIDLNSTDTAFVCFGETITPGNLVYGGQPSWDIPSCLTPGFVLHSTTPIPDPVSGSGFTYIDTLQGWGGAFVNNSNGSGSFGNPLFNTVYYVSSMADETSTFGDFTCISSTVDNQVKVIFLQPIVSVSNYDPTLCEISFTSSGGYVGFTGSNFSYTIQDGMSNVVATGTFAAGTTVTWPVSAADIYTVTINDGQCPYSIVLDATACTNPCIVNPNINFVNASICDGQSIFLQGANQTTPGLYTDVFVGANGCDSTIYTTLTLNAPSTFEQTVTICQGDSFTPVATTYSTSGVYHDTIVAVNGCDSVVVTNLFVESTLYSSISETVCNGGSYNFNGTILTSSGTYVNTLTATFGCDSVVTLYLTISPVLTGNTSATICEGSSINFGAQTLSSSGQYTETFPGSNGCDSIVTMYLFVTPEIESNYAATICEGQTYAFDGQQLSTAGEYTAQFTTANGCDSLVRLFLSVTAPTDSTIAAGICQGDTYVFGTQTLNNAGIYSETFQTPAGCDQLVYLELSVTDCEAALEISNICTPNDDSRNDTWQVSDLTQISGCTVQIFNRWGQLLYETDDYQNDWAGTHEGKALPDGVFYYVITCSDDRLYQGSINLMRFKK